MLCGNEDNCGQHTSEKPTPYHVSIGVYNCAFARIASHGMLAEESLLASRQRGHSPRVKVLPVLLAPGPIALVHAPQEVPK